MDKILTIILGVSLLLYFLRMAIAAGLFDDLFEGELTKINNASVYVMLSSLLAGLVGIGTSVIGLMHARGENFMPKATAVAVGIITVMLDWQAFGFSAKQWKLNDKAGADLDDSLQTLGSFALFQLILQTIYLVYINRAAVSAATSSVASAPQ